MSGLSSPQPLTQKQIADQLGVSRQLVGLALSGRGKVAEGTRQRILAAAKQNGYDQFSNSEARLMISRRYGTRISTGLLAVLFSSNFENQPLALVPYFTPIFHGLELEAKASGLDLMLCPIRPDELPRLVRDRQLDGVICLSAPHRVSREIKEMGLLVVNIQSDVEGISCVLRDDFGGGLQATRHLIGLGHRKIAHIGTTAPSGQARYAAFREALHTHGLEVNENLVDISIDEPTQKAGELAMCAMLKQREQHPFTALVANNDLLAMGAIRALQDAGLEVPTDVSVVGFDDVAEQYDFKPSLTSICFNREEMGRRAVRMLLELSASDTESAHAGNTTSLREIFSTQLVLRESTSSPRHENTNKN